ncbi:hypothetical protein [Cytobacillus purgationiresistens]|uniref:Membrane protein YqiK n=1 Tax=Cytobacillus purgationiresistens TaxID=863449 RepID=A0ABU0AIZ8_9BACI|nr:hypothetical protein [Cytobacillus purgationiresistens]MDQ0270742.1 putative membrane protein YqiK [Cytobacillus purgationiresistens]
MRYRKKPVEVEAIQFTDDADSITQISDFADNVLVVRYSNSDTTELVIDTLEGLMSAQVGDYIIRGVAGEFYPCKPDIFEQTYEKV